MEDTNKNEDFFIRRWALSTDTGRKIREANPYAIIVFITTKSEFASITYRYKVSALDFIDKNLNEDLFRLKIKECIEYLTTIQIGNDDLTDYFEYDFKDKKIKIKNKKQKKKFKEIDSK